MYTHGASQVPPVIKNLPANAGDARDADWIPGSGSPLEEEMATHSSILSWRIPWTEKHGRPQSMGLQRLNRLSTRAHRDHFKKIGDIKDFIIGYFMQGWAQ